MAGLGRLDGPSSSLDELLIALAKLEIAENSAVSVEEAAQLAFVAEECCLVEGWPG